ncbi:hypothetical protein H6P81_003992 [Aristolochia fimbriata]|uniref:DUF7787 domain-containing protein n=1 Tax=Aristolochia fimbriata TaxID=158543 RepID=A0AAV7FFZ8_ARIFI|nr:hypothetical protein H6P81_003992 [Aristolochia fimbriata]
MDLTSQVSESESRPREKMRPGRLSLENYDDFIQNPRQRNELSSWKLNEIIKMHGFNKLWNHKKTEILEAVCSIDDLMNSRRSTLKDSTVSSEAFLSIGEVKQDLVNLEWQTCEVQTLQIVRLANEKNAMTQDLETICLSSRFDRLEPQQKKRRVSKTKGIASTVVASCSSSTSSQLVKDNSSAASDLVAVPISGGE